MNISSLTLEMTRVSLISDVGQPFSVVCVLHVMVESHINLAFCKIEYCKMKISKLFHLHVSWGNPTTSNNHVSGWVVVLFHFLEVVEWNSNLTKIKESPSFKNDMCALS